MAVLRYNKTSSTETEDIKKLTLHFSGSQNGIVFDLKVSGDADSIGDKVRDLKLDMYGKHVEFELKNNQKEIGEYDE